MLLLWFWWWNKSPPLWSCAFFFEPAPHKGQREKQTRPPSLLLLLVLVVDTKAHPFGQNQRPCFASPSFPLIVLLCRTGIFFFLEAGSPKRLATCGASAPHEPTATWTKGRGGREKLKSTPELPKGGKKKDGGDVSSPHALLY